VTRAVIVKATVNTEKPVITLKPGNDVKTEITISVGEDYVEPGYTCEDNVDGDCTELVLKDYENFDPFTIGVHTIKYSYTDSNDNVGEVYRVVEVVEGTEDDRDKTMNYYDSNLPEYNVEENYLPNIPTNYRDRREGSEIKAVVVHWTAAPNQLAINTRQHFVNVDNVSSNYIIGPTGKILSIVPNDKTAYCNGGTAYDELLGKRVPVYTELVYDKFVSEEGYLRHNDYTISIETNPIDSDGNFSNETYTALVRLTADLLIEYGLTVEEGVYRHHDFTSKDCPRVFTNPEDAFQYTRDENNKLIAVTPKSKNAMWEQFKNDVAKAMNR